MVSETQTPAANWSRTVDRGPNCLVVTLHPPKDGQLGEYHLAEDLVALLEEHFKQHLVLEMNEVDVVFSALLSELVMLCKKIKGKGGLLRLSGLSPAATDVFRATALEQFIATYPSSGDAMMTFHHGHDGSPAPSRSPVRNAGKSQVAVTASDDRGVDPQKPR